MDETRALARLPRLDIEITHRRLAEEDAEELQVTIRAAPSARAVGEMLGGDGLTWLPFAPFLFWQRTMQAFWAPWLAAPPWLLPPPPAAPPEDAERRAAAADNVHPFPVPGPRED